MYPRRIRLLGGLSTFVFALTVLAAPVVAAQESADPSEEQVRLNDQALEAMNDGNYVRAASLLEESNHLGELNIIYLNLGRTYQKMGRCADARAALDKVAGAPKIEKPSADFIEEKARDYLAEIEASCEAKEQDGSQQSDADTVEPTPSPDNTRSTWGYLSLGSGIGLLATSGAFAWQASTMRADIEGADGDADGFADDMTRQQALAKQDDANLYDTLAVSGAAAGAVLVGTGVYLLVTPESSASQLSVAPGPDSLSVSWHLRF